MKIDQSWKNLQKTVHGFFRDISDCSSIYFQWEMMQRCKARNSKSEDSVILTNECDVKNAESKPKIPGHVRKLQIKDCQP